MTNKHTHPKPRRCTLPSERWKYASIWTVDHHDPQALAAWKAERSRISHDYWAYLDSIYDRAKAHGLQLSARFDGSEPLGRDLIYEIHQGDTLMCRMYMTENYAYDVLERYFEDIEDGVEIQPLPDFLI